MSTSPSWFDQEKFSRLKKVGPKVVVLKPLSTTAPLPNPATLQPPVQKESQFLPEQKVSQPLPEPPASEAAPEVKESQPLPVEEKASEASPEAAEPPVSEATPEVKESQPLPVEEKADETLPEAASEPPPEVKASQPLPEPETPSEEDLSPVPATPQAASQRMMTSQSVSLKNLRSEIPPVAPPTPEPIRAPADSSGPKAPPLPIDSKVLLRRTSTLPALKAITQPDGIPVVLDPAASLPVRAPAASAAVVQSAEDLAAAWEKITQLNFEVELAVKERDQALTENVLLRDQLKQADEQITLQDAAIEHTEAMERIQLERDDALADAKSLREELQQTLAAKASSVSSEELNQTIEERDRMRRQYMDLREQFEILKQEHLHGSSGSGNSASSEELNTVRGQLAAKEQEVGSIRQQLSELENERDSIRLLLSAQRAEVELIQGQLAERAKELESARQDSGGNSSELENLRQQLAAKDQELAAAKQNNGGDEALKAEITSLREQVEQAKEEASIPQRGLALSQKALKETRDALREANDGAALAKASLENIKKENATLVQQNMLLQAQNDQVSRELSSVKAKLLAKG